MTTRVCVPIVVLIFMLFGCSRCTGALRAESVELDDVEGYFVRSGAPHPKACIVDDDCVSGPGVNPGNGCCDTGVHNGVYGRSYIDWRRGWSQENCGDVECSLQPPPAPPQPCALDGRCAEGRCENTCEGSSY